MSSTFMTPSFRFVAFESWRGASFAQIPTYSTLNLTETTGGTTSPAPGLIPVPSGSLIAVTATSNPHYIFDHWQSDTSNNLSNPIMVQMDTNHTLRAIFTPLPNLPPGLSVPGSQVTAEGSTISFTVNATDTDLSETIALSASGLPKGATFDPSTGSLTQGNPVQGLFSWTPSEGQGPANYLVTFVATDDGAPPLSDEATVAIHVNEANLPPSLHVPWRETVTEPQSLNFTVSASDPDLPPDTLTLSAVSIPSGAAFNSATGRFTWTPTLVQATGNYTLTFSVSDGQLTDTKSVVVLVSAANQPPIMSVPATQTVDPGTPLAFTVVATDPDLPPESISLSATGLPRGAVFDTDSGLFTWTPAANQGPGVYNLAFTANDGHGGTVTHRVTVNVNRIPLGTSSLPGLTDWGALWYIPVPILILEILAFVVVLRRRTRKPVETGSRTV